MAHGPSNADDNVKAPLGIGTLVHSVTDPISLLQRCNGGEIDRRLD